MAGLLGFLAAYLHRVCRVQYELAGHGWVTGDWLINFSNGFVRRGLSGEIAGFLAGLTGTDLVSAVIACKIACYLAIAAGLLFLAWTKKLGLVELLLLMCPWGLMFELNSVGASGRKEIVLLAVFIAYLCLSTGPARQEVPLHRRWRLWYLGVSFTVLTLIHEGLFFFLPFFWLHAMGVRRRWTRADVLEFAIPYGVSLLLVAGIALWFSGDGSHAAKICQSLTSRGVDGSLCHGAVSALGRTFAIHAGYYPSYAAGFLLSVAAVICYGLSVHTRGRGRMVLAAFLCVLLTIPLYVLAIDWGRWIHVTAFLMFLSFYATKDVERPAWRVPSPILGFLVLVGLFFYVFVWGFPHYLSEDGHVVLYLQDVTEWVGRFR